MYVCVMFPYPSSDGLHVGHAYNYAIIDTYCRWKRDSVDVFQPFGYDAFGLPAENYARKIGGDPKTITYSNIDKFRHQMDYLNTEYEERLITCDESYIKWTQWLFQQLYNKGLAYKKYGSVNYCTSCETVLANEQVQNGACERCSTKIEFRELNQWYFKITEYRDRLIKGLSNVDYPQGTIKQQKRWLNNLNDWCVSRQRKWGCPIPIEGETDTLDTFVDSSFYYLRYLTDSQDEFLPSSQYKSVDLYVGGPEHACMHLIYARFINMFLYDLGIVKEEEPFKKLYHQGMITRNGAKMSKSTGNTVDILNYNPSELRMYLMFIGPYDKGGDWNDKDIIGIQRFFKRFKTWLSNPGSDKINTEELYEKLNQQINTFRFNLIFPTLCNLYNNNKNKKPNQESINKIVSYLEIIAPGIL